MPQDQKLISPIIQGQDELPIPNNNKAIQLQPNNDTVFCFDDQRYLELTTIKIKTIEKDLFFNNSHDDTDSQELYEYFNQLELSETENSYILNELNHKFFNLEDVDIEYNSEEFGDIQTLLIKSLFRTAKQNQLHQSQKVEIDLLNLIDNEFHNWVESMTNFLKFSPTT